MIQEPGRPSFLPGRSPVPRGPGDVLDLWVESEGKPRRRGKCIFVRYCDDFLFGVERQDDAEWLMRVAGKAGGDVWTDHPSGQDAPGVLWATVPGTPDRQGAGQLRFPRAQAVWEAVPIWILDLGIPDPQCAPHAGQSVKEPHMALVRHVRGHMNYFGVNGNIRSLHLLLVQVQRAWFKWLRRRSQRTRLTWERYQDLLQDFPLPRPRIVVQIWGR